MNENLYIVHKQTSTQNLACSQCQIHTEHTCKLSQAKNYQRTCTHTKRYKQLLPTHPFPKVELYIAVRCKMASTSAIWQQAEHTTYQLSSPSCSTRAIQKSLTLNEKYLRVFWRTSQENGPISRKMTKQKEKED